jgi:1,4-alpha-glucan branching enzyme
MQQTQGEDGAVVFEAEVPLSSADVGKEFQWSVLLDGPLGLDREGIVTEQHGLGHDALHRTFVLADGNGEQRYYLTHVRRFGARKVRQPGSEEFGLRFAVWAPNAQAVDVVSVMPRAAISPTTAPGWTRHDRSFRSEKRPMVSGRPDPKLTRR